MATDEAKTPLPGDIIQAVKPQNLSGHLLLVTQVKSWGVGAVLRWPDGVNTCEAYYRMKPDRFVIVGTAAILPPDLAEARNIAMKDLQDRNQASAPQGAGA